MAKRSPKTKRTIIEEEIDEEPAGLPPIDPRQLQDDDTLDYALGQYDDRNGLELKYYLVRPGGSAFIGAYPDVVSDSQLQEWYPEGGKFEIRIYIHGEFRDRRFTLIGPRPGSHASGGNGGDPYLRQQLANLENKLENLRAQPSGDLKSLIEAMTAFQAMQAPKVDETQKTLEVLKMGMEFAKTGSFPTDEERSPWLDIVKEAMPFLGGMLTAKNGNPNPPIQANPQQQLQQMLQEGLAWLKRKSLAQVDPGLYIDLILEEARTGDTRFQELLAVVASQEFSAFASLDPELANEPHATFFRAIYDGLRSALAESNTVDDNTSGAKRDDGNVGGDAAVGKRGGK